MLAGEDLAMTLTQQAATAINTKADFGWLIETGDHKYWNGRHANADGFTHDPNDAVRFARFEDSERVIYWLMREYAVFLASRQHKWIDGVAS